MKLAHWLIVGAVVVVGAGVAAPFVLGWGPADLVPVDDGEKEVTIDEVPAAVKATILREAAGNEIEEIEVETEHVFAVEVTRSTGTVTYQWRKGGLAIPGATSATYTLESADLTDTGWYTCLITDEAPSVVETGPVHLLVVPVGGLAASGTASAVLLAAACALLGARVLRRRNRHA